MKSVLLSMILLVGIFSCNVLKQDTKNIDKAAIRHPELLAKKARDMFPCVTTNGDTIYLSDSAAYIAALNELQDTSFSLYHRNDSLLSKLDSLQKDSVCFKLVDLYTQIINNQKKDYQKLEDKIKHIPPIIKTITIHDTTIDNAAVKVCETEKSTIISLLDKKTIENEGWKKKAKNRFWIILAMGAIIGVVAYVKIAGIFKPKTV